MSQKSPEEIRQLRTTCLVVEVLERLPFGVAQEMVRRSIGGEELKLHMTPPDIVRYAEGLALRLWEEEIPTQPRSR